MRYLEEVRYLILMATLLFLSTACTMANSKGPHTMELTNKEKAVSLIESIETGNPKPIGYINPNTYIQHNLAVADGLAGFGAVMQQLPEGSARARVVRALQDGEYTVTHTEYDFFGPKIGFDIFRFEDGLIVEHWDNLQEIETKTVSGRSQIDGQTAITDIDKTLKNKELVKGFVTNVLMGGDPNTITEYIAPDNYLQHNPAVGDGLAALGAALESMAKAGTPMVYEKNHMILGEGNFVLAVSEGQFLGKHAAFYDLFRVENGMIVEHWDTIESIPPRELWKNGNGKF